MFVSGLIDTVAVYSVSPSDGGYGNIADGLTLLATLLGRFTKLTGQETNFPRGLDATKAWSVILAHTTVLDDTSKVYRLKKGSVYYDVVWVQRQRNAKGVYHHVSLAVTEI